MPNRKHYSVSTFIQLRQFNQQLLKSKFKFPTDLLKYFGAVQAQDYSGAKWAIGHRLIKAADNDIEKAIAERKIIRAWPLRSTLHFTAAEDIRWILELTAPRIDKTLSLRDKHLGITEKIQNKSNDVFIKSLEGKKELTREELIAELKKAGIKADGVFLSHLLYRAGRNQLVCFGVNRGKQVTYTLLDEWVPKTKNLHRDEALAELTRRYFQSHGPASIQDYTWWSGLTAADTKSGLEMIKPELIRMEIEGRVFWLPKEVPDTKGKYTGVYLLPWWDEYLVAYKDRTAVLDPGFTKLVNAGGGMLNPTVIINGRVAGIWKREIKKDKIIINLKQFTSFSKAEKDKTVKAAEKYGKFYGAGVKVEFNL